MLEVVTLFLVENGLDFYLWSGMSVVHGKVVDRVWQLAESDGVLSACKYNQLKRRWQVVAEFELADPGSLGELLKLVRG